MVFSKDGNDISHPTNSCRILSLHCQEAESNFLLLESGWTCDLFETNWMWQKSFWLVLGLHHKRQCSSWLVSWNISSWRLSLLKKQPGCLYVGSCHLVRKPSQRSHGEVPKQCEKRCLDSSQLFQHPLSLPFKLQLPSDCHYMRSPKSELPSLPKSLMQRNCER